MKLTNQQLKRIIKEEYDTAEINKLKVDVDGHMGMISVLASLLKQLPEFKDVPIAKLLADAKKGVMKSAAGRAEADAFMKQIARAAGKILPDEQGLTKPAAKRVAQLEGNTTMKKLLNEWRLYIDKNIGPEPE